MKYGLTLALMAAAFAGGWQIRDSTAQRDLRSIQADYAELFAAAQQRARQHEHVLQQKMEVLQHETQHQLAEISAFERAAADNRVRELSARYAAGSTGSHSPASSRCQTERTRAAVLAELLAELDELAAVFAFEADRRKVAGLACEKAYKTVQSR